MAKGTIKERDGYAVLLPSGRGVRLLELLASERDEVMKNAAKIVDKDATVADYRLQQVKEGVNKMIKAVTVKKSLKQEDLVSPDTKWVDVNPLDLEDDYDTYFTAKDDGVLAAIYHKLHEVSLSDVEAITSKMQPVSMG